MNNNNNNNNNNNPVKSHIVGSGEGRVYADLTPTKVGRLFPKDPRLNKNIKRGQIRLRDSKRYGNEVTQATQIT